MKYGLGKEGATECQTGSKVLDKSQCESACKHINMPYTKGSIALQDGKPCFRGIAGSGTPRCRQNANMKINEALICERSKSGNAEYCPFSAIRTFLNKRHCLSCSLITNFFPIPACQRL